MLNLGYFREVYRYVCCLICGTGTVAVQVSLELEERSAQNAMINFRMITNMQKGFV